MEYFITEEELRDEKRVQDLCRKAKEPVIVMHEGKPDSVVMSTELYKERFLLRDVHRGVTAAERELCMGNPAGARELLKGLGDMLALFL